jgi:8-oxo-dGTP pyrophosphatase MutT (NUDIX family)
MKDRTKTLRIAPWLPVAEEHLGDYVIFGLSRTARRSPNTGREHRFIRLDAPDWVNVIAVSESGQLVLVEQYRHGTDDITLEIPGGAVDPGEDPRAAAARELEEETGFRPAEMHQIGVVETNPAFMSNRCWTYLALSCTASGTVRPDPSEEIALRMVELGELSTLIDSGAIRHSLVIAAHDHLRRGLQNDLPWVPAVSALLESPPPGHGVR